MLLLPDLAIFLRNQPHTADKAAATKSSTYLHGMSQSWCGILSGIQRFPAGGMDTCAIVLRIQKRSERCSAGCPGIQGYGCHHCVERSPFSADRHGRTGFGPVTVKVTEGDRPAE